MRERFTKQEQKWLKPYENKFFRLNYDKCKDEEVTKFKEKVADKFIEHFEVIENLDRVRERVCHRFSNAKRNAKTKGLLNDENKGIDKKSMRTITEFFQHIQTCKLSGRDVWVHENKEQTNAKVAAKANKPENKTKTDLYEALPTEVCKQYEQLAAEENAAKHEVLVHSLDDSVVLENQRQLKSVMLKLLSALPGRENNFSVGDAMFVLNMAYVTPSDGKVVTETIYTYHGNASFRECKKYEKYCKIFSTFAKEVFEPLKDNVQSECTIIDVDTLESTRGDSSDMAALQSDSIQQNCLGMQNFSWNPFEDVWKAQALTPLPTSEIPIPSPLHIFEENVAAAARTVLQPVRGSASSASENSYDTHIMLHESSAQADPSTLEESPESEETTASSSLCRMGTISS